MINIRIIKAVVMIVAFSAYSQLSNAQKDTDVVVLFGDSISLGYNDAYVAQFGLNDRQGGAREFHGEPTIQLAALLNNSSRKSRVFNDGWGGTSSGPEGPDSQVIALNNGVSRINSDLVQIKVVYPEAEFKDYYLLIIYGTNDFAFSISPTTTGFNNRVIINAAKANGYIPVVGTIPPCFVGCGFISSINGNIVSAVNATNTNASPVYFADHYSKLLPNWNNLNDDGVHPNDAGYLVIAENWFDSVLESLIEPTTSMITVTPILNLLLDE